jgi:hypothetical protein
VLKNEPRRSSAIKCGSADQTSSLASWFIGNARVWGAVFVEVRVDRALGEIGVVGVAPALANAVFHATGLRIREFPILPQRLLAEN